MSELITEERAFDAYMPFPPFLSRARIDGYVENLRRFKGEYNEGKFIRIKNLQGKIEKFPIITENYYSVKAKSL